MMGHKIFLKGVMCKIIPNYAITSYLAHWQLLFISCLQELNRTNRQMQQRIVELLEGVPNEEVTSKYTLSRKRYKC